MQDDRYKSNTRATYCRQHLDALMIEEHGTVRLQPCKSPVRDTAITLRSLAAAGLEPAHRAARRAVDWLLEREVRRRGDWSKTVPAEPAGWCFEYANEFYPDVDDTAMVLMALASQLESAGPGTPPTELRLVDHFSAASPGEARQRILQIVRTAHKG